MSPRVSSFLNLKQGAYPVDCAFDPVVASFATDSNRRPYEPFASCIVATNSIRRMNREGNEANR